MATANSSIKPLVRYPINISIDVEDLESDEDIPRSLKGSNNVKSRLVEPNLAEPRYVGISLFCVAHFC